MSRPKAANAAATRRRILTAAGSAFAEHGREGASIRGISSAASVSLAMVHHYFGSKDGLYEACIDAMYRELEPLRVDLLASLIPGQDLESLLERAVRTGFRFARAHLEPCRLLFRQLTTHGELDEHRRETQQRPFLDTAAAAIAALTGRDPAALRLPLQSALVLVARYGISSETELQMFAPAGAALPAAAVEDHLVRAAHALLLPPNQESPS